MEGLVGVISWTDPTTADIKSSASLLALSLRQAAPYILNPSASFRQLNINRVDVGLWTVGAETLVLATNLNYATTTIRLSDLGLKSSGIKQVLNSGALVTTDKTGFTFESVGSGAFVVTK
ncbi:hypothetical protein DXG03_006850 [Asterophora parasitica]|uniref:Uncharacterized protein n=1 Tax=Asterophora parasitica TaxID=117018 RepID=A0A9P7KC13_9AGAR|nr:hypothetical protein DXG03_006850 [Asterophora parasitica]